MNVEDLNRVVRRAAQGMRPPEDLTVSEWADRYRWLSPEASAEPGPWRTSRTPYLKEPMDAVTDPNCEMVTVMASSQVGKSEGMIQDVLGYVIDQDPGPVLLVQPTLDEARNFSRTRVRYMIRDSPTLRAKVSEPQRGRGKAARNVETVLQRTFPGGTLTITGANSASALASKPIRYLLGDEVDRWPFSAGREGDPWGLAAARTETFYNRKLIRVSTPTVKGASAIAEAYEQGTRESWCHRCPHCGEFSRITFDDIRFDKTCREVDGRTVWEVVGEPEWRCPECGALSTESEMRDAPQRWIAADPGAYESRRHRSFRLNAFCSPWTPWSHVIVRFLESKDDPEKLKVVYNTLFGELWENRGDVPAEADMLERREDYGRAEDGTPVEVPDGALVLTMGVDVQDNRLEYEVVGHGRWGETWGIRRGVIDGRADEEATWGRVDALCERGWRRADGTTVSVSLTCVDSGGHYTQEVYEACRARWHRRVVAIKGVGGEGRPFVAPPSDVPVKSRRYRVRLYTLGVDAGKARIMDDLKVREPGPRYAHFPSREDAGYDLAYFEGLLSEHLVLSDRSKVNRWTWEKIPGHDRNEPLDCRNYALAAVRILDPPWDQLERERRGEGTKPKAPKARRRRRRRPGSAFDGW